MEKPGSGLICDEELFLLHYEIKNQEDHHFFISPYELELEVKVLRRKEASPERRNDGTGAENFSCVLHSYTFKDPSMNCTWMVGKKAPPDTQYFLYFQYFGSWTLPKGEERTCPHYLKNEHGIQVGCYFPNVTIDTYTFRFRVNGSSESSSVQPFTYDAFLYNYERLDPPHDITVNCPEQALFCTVQWKPPPNIRNVSYACYNYQIKDEITNTIMNVADGITSRNFTQGTKYILKLRTGGNDDCVITGKFGEWSKQIEFGTSPNQFPVIHLVLVALGTILIILLLVLICKRSHLWQNLTEPVPQPKNITWQLEKNMEKVWVDQMLPADENITVVEEMLRYALQVCLPDMKDT
ncbi:Interleukin-5 receptor subunit alpha [Varanus komodoensis]|nr:Interleukin-5 receptor subunit alpha [Varanus komodoensis]